MVPQRYEEVLAAGDEAHVAPLHLDDALPWRVLLSGGGVGGACVCVHSCVHVCVHRNVVKGMGAACACQGVRAGLPSGKSGRTADKSAPARPNTRARRRPLQRRRPNHHGTACGGGSETGSPARLCQVMHAPLQQRVRRPRPRLRPRLVPAAQPSNGAAWPRVGASTGASRRALPPPPLPLHLPPPAAADMGSASRGAACRAAGAGTSASGGSPQPRGPHL